MTQEITVDHTPTKMAMAYVSAGYAGIAILGQVVRMTAKNIWIDTTKTQCFIWQGKIRYRLLKNGQYSCQYSGEKLKLYFEPNPLEEFLSNGL
jgi:hypothetical protein